MTARWPPTEYGLWVDFGHFHTARGVWLRWPTARFTCRHGCLLEAVGPPDVADFTQRIDQNHAWTCPGPRKDTPHV